MSTLLSALTKWLETQLNANTFGIEFDLGYLFERDEFGFWNVRVSGENKYLNENVDFIPAMFGSFTGDWNKPQNYKYSGQLSKGGSTALYFSLPDKDLQDEMYDNTLKALEEFENNLAGLRNEDGSQISLVVEAIEDSPITYTISITSSPGQGNGVVKFGAGWRVLFTVSISVKAAIGVCHGETIKTEIKRFGADDSTYVAVEIPEVKNGKASSPELAQTNLELESFAGLVNSVYNKTFIIYYPFGVVGLFTEGMKDLLVEFFRRVEDKDYNPTNKYTVKTTYPDFEAVRDFKFLSGHPNIVKGQELSMTIMFVPFKEITQ